MKQLKNITGFIGLAILLLNFAWAQDSTKTQQRDKDQAKVQSKVKAEVKDQNQAGKQEDTQADMKKKTIHGPNFVDQNNDGYNDNAPDHDGDGIPNGQDPDYTGAGKGKRQQQFVDNDGDGIADNLVKQGGKGYGSKQNRRGGYGPGDGTGNQGVRPQDGTGYGPGAKSGNCDGTGPKGNRRGKSGK
jgi:hypothetical protein